VIVRKTGFESWGGMADVQEGTASQARCRLLDLVGGEDLLGQVARAATGLDDDDPLDAGLRSVGGQAKLSRLLLGRLVKRGEGVAFTLVLYDVASGEVIQHHAGELREDAPGFARSVDGVVSYLITGRGDVLQSTQQEVADAEAKAELRLKDEELFVEETTPVYETWYFWTAVGAAAGTTALLLALLLPGDAPPRSQILLEFETY
jgi:hypothetical protein